MYSVGRSAPSVIGKLRRQKCALALGLLVAALNGCAAPAARFHAAADNRGFSHESVMGAGFRHAVFTAVRAAAPEVLHIYLDGDGRPWRAGGRPALDPTPRGDLVLRLMARDPASKVYLGRPCYHGHHRDAGCAAGLWTHGRYAEPIVASMAAAIERLQRRYGHPQLVLIGYSGGGSLALLLAPRLPDVRAVVTLAANFDVQAWTRHHGHTPLRGSLHPLSIAALDADVTQIHAFGLRDRQVPPAITRAIARTQPSARLVPVEEADHGCCWQRHWPELMSPVHGGSSLTPAPR